MRPASEEPVGEPGQLFSADAAVGCGHPTWHPCKPPYPLGAHSPLLCWRVGEVTLRMQGVSWPSLSCDESLERSLERRRSRERSQPPLAPCRLIFLCSASTRDARPWLLFQTKATFRVSLTPQATGYMTDLSLSQEVQTYFVTRMSIRYNSSVPSCVVQQANYRCDVEFPTCSHQQGR